ncbi:hypothetical protein ACWEOW_23310 [Monashia sp. NPDC004114]
MRAIAAELLPPDSHAWTLEPLTRNGNVLITRTTSEPAESIELLDTGTGAFVLSIGDRISYADFGYEEPDDREVMREQLGRVRAYLDGEVTRREKTRGDRLIATQLSFPDGLTLTMHHGSVMSLLNRIFKSGMSSATADFRE